MLLQKIFSQYLGSPSLRGVSRSNPLYLDCHDFLRSLAMTIKNNLEILNSVKTFFTYMVVGALVMALSVSCKSNEEPVDEEKVGENPPAGEYTYGNQNKVTVSADGTISGELVYPISDSESLRINFNVTVNSWYTYGDGYHYVKEGSYTVNNINSGYSFDSDRGIAWRNLNGKTLLSININGNGAGFQQLTLN